MTTRILCKPKFHQIYWEIMEFGLLDVLAASTEINEALEQLDHDLAPLCWLEPSHQGVSLWCSPYQWPLPLLQVFEPATARHKSGTLGPCSPDGWAHWLVLRCYQWWIRVGTDKWVINSLTHWLPNYGWVLTNGYWGWSSQRMGLSSKMLRLTFDSGVNKSAWGATQGPF